MKLGRYLGALINTRSTLAAKPGSVEKTSKNGTPRHAKRKTKQAQVDKRMGEGAAELQKVLG